MIALTSAAIDLCPPPAPPRSTRPLQEESRSTSALMPAAGWSCALARRRKAKAMTDGLYVCAQARRPTSARPAAWPPFSHHPLAVPLSLWPAFSLSEVVHLPLARVDE